MELTKFQGCPKTVPLSGHLTPLLLPEPTLSTPAARPADGPGSVPCPISRVDPQKIHEPWSMFLVPPFLCGELSEPLGPYSAGNSRPNLRSVMFGGGTCLKTSQHPKMPCFRDPLKLLANVMLNAHQVSSPLQEPKV